MKTLLLVSAFLFSTLSFAGPGSGHSHSHSHDNVRSHDSFEITKEKSKEAGKFHLQRLVKAGKLDASWSKATYGQAEKKKFGNKTEWVVTFKNEKDPKNKKLFIFLKLSGELVAANFTGK